jgi:hypothetical protein
VKKVIVRYIVGEGDAPREEVLAIGPAEEIQSKRELANTPGADGEYALYYRSFLAARRTGSCGQAVKFDQWLRDVAEVEPRLSMKDVDDLEGTGECTEAQAEYLRRRIVELGDDEGESPAPLA